MGAIVDLCDDDDDSPVLAPEQSAEKQQPGKRLFASLSEHGVHQPKLSSPCNKHSKGCGVGEGRQHHGSHEGDGSGAAYVVDAALAPNPYSDNLPIERHAINADKETAGRADLEHKTAEKQSMQADGKANKQRQAAAKKAVKEAEKAEKAGLKNAEKAAKAVQKAKEQSAKAAERRARGKKADQEVTVLLDISLRESKAKSAVLDALESHDVKFSYREEAGKLRGWSTITWERENSSMVGPSGISFVPYVMVVLDDAEAQNLLASESSVKSFLDSITSTYGEVSVSLLMIALQRKLVTKDRKEHTHAVRTGDISAACGGNKSMCLLRLLSLHFRYEGITYRDCHDAQQAAEHVVGITSAIAKQAYKGGHDVLAAFTRKGSDRLESTAAASNLTEKQKTCAKTLHALEWGPKQASSVAQQLQSFGAVAQQYFMDSNNTCKSITVMKTDTGRNVGPHAAKKLHFFLTCEDPDAPFNE